jgi:hypothetical protein
MRDRTSLCHLQEQAQINQIKLHKPLSFMPLSSSTTRERHLIPSSTHNKSGRGRLKSRADSLSVTISPIQVLLASALASRDPLTGSAEDA